MKTVRGPELDELLKIDDDVVAQLRTMYRGGSTPAEMVRFLAGKGLPKPGAIIALRRANVMDGSEAKRVVHFSQEYAYCREADEAFYEAAETFAEQGSQAANAA